MGMRAAPKKGVAAAAAAAAKAAATRETRNKKQSPFLSCFKWQQLHSQCFAPGLDWKKVKIGLFVKVL
jgi:hypothetical protein